MNSLMSGRRRSQVIEVNLTKRKTKIINKTGKGELKIKRKVKHKIFVNQKAVKQYIKKS